MTSATIAHLYRKILNKYALETTGTTDAVQWQGHDFSMRGMSSLESACTSGAAHLLSFTGTDTVPAIEFLERYYSADVEKELVGASVPATEHSVMCMGLKDGEVKTFKRLLEMYPTGILSVVSDTWDLWHVVRRGGICEQLKDQILSRDGKLVIRPDSGDPVDIICGWEPAHSFYGEDYLAYLQEFQEEKKQNPNSENKLVSESEFKGVVESLWDIFGGTTTKEGYKVLNPCIGAIYGDSITTERCIQICERLKSKGFASTNIVLGIGSFTYQYNTRDTFGMAMKATYGEVLEDIGEMSEEILVPTGREIFKDPITDRKPDGTSEKKSARGLLRVDRDTTGKITLYQQQRKEQEEQGMLKLIFLDGKMIKKFTLAEVRQNLKDVV